MKEVKATVSLVPQFDSESSACMRRRSTWKTGIFNITKVVNRVYQCHTKAIHCLTDWLTVYWPYKPQEQRSAFLVFFFWAPFSPEVFKNHKYRISGWKLVYLSKRKFQPWNQFTWYWLLPLSWILLRPLSSTQTLLMTAAKVQPLISGAACEEQGDPWPVFKYNFL